MSASEHEYVQGSQQIHMKCEAVKRRNNYFCFCASTKGNDAQLLVAANKFRFLKPNM